MAGLDHLILFSGKWTICIFNFMFLLCTITRKVETLERTCFTVNHKNDFSSRSDVGHVCALWSSLEGIFQKPWKFLKNLKVLNLHEYSV